MLSNKLFFEWISKNPFFVFIQNKRVGNELGIKYIRSDFNYN
jgi:hypothetical protein